MENKQASPPPVPAVENMLQQILQAVQTSSDGLAQVRRECEELRRTNARLESQLVRHESGHPARKAPAPDAKHSPPVESMTPPAPIPIAPPASGKAPLNPPSPFIGGVKPAYARGFAREPAKGAASAGHTTSDDATRAPVNTAMSPVIARRQAMATMQRPKPAGGIDSEQSPLCRAPRGPYADLLRRAVC
ncbi:hypothetical protein HDZ31DRAFT_72510 [Schizophyllum fasciatum]